MLHKIGDAETVDWKRAYDYSPDGILPQVSNRLRATSLAGDDIDDPTTYSSPYTHDVHGNMIAMPHIQSLTWDEDDRLQSTDRGSGGTTYYVYDGAGQRVRKVHLNDAETTRKQRLYFGAWELYREEHNINTTPVLDLERATLHVHDDIGRICLIETKTAEDDVPIADPANTARYQYSNHLGTVALELDDDAEVISYEEFHPYGTSSYAAANSAIEVSPKRYRYTGKERDEETGLSYHGSRYYASWLARWASCDPIGLSDDTNRYAYVANQPLNWQDHTGTRKESKGGATTPDPKVQEAEIMAVMAEDTTLTPQGAVDVWTQRKKGAQPTPITSSSQGAENLAKLQKETQEKNGLQYDANKQVAEAVTGDPEQSLDKLQSALDTAGLVEVLGTPADVANAVISLFRGNGKDAALSGASALPFGFFFAGVKIAGKRGDKAADAVGSLGDDAIGTGTSAARRASSFLTDTEFESLAQASFGGATKRVPLTKPTAKGTPDVEIDLISDSGDTFTQIKRVTSDKAVFAGKNQE